MFSKKLEWVSPERAMAVEKFQSPEEGSFLNSYLVLITEHLTEHEDHKLEASHTKFQSNLSYREGL